MKVEITNEEKILFPKSKISKKEFVQYYKKNHKKILPHIINRPLSLKRFPNGIKDKIFFQKKALDYYPKWIKKIKIKKQEGSIIMPVITNLDSLLYIANQVGEFHIALSKIDKLDKPDKIIFDLDPSKQSFSKVIKASFDLKKILDELKLPTFFMTTGSKGMHVIIPIKREKTFDEIREFAKKIAKKLVDKYPSEYTIEPRKEKRKSKIYIDYLRNSFSQTTVAPYTIRAIEEAPIAMPITFNELKDTLSSQKFNIKNSSSRKKDPFKLFDSKAVSIKKKLKNLFM